MRFNNKRIAFTRTEDTKFVSKVNHLDERNEIALLLTNETLGQQIAHHRKKQQLIQKELAAITGICHKHIGDIDRGRMLRIHTFARLAAGLGVSIEDLIVRR